MILRLVRSWHPEKADLVVTIALIGIQEKIIVIMAPFVSTRKITIH